MKPYSLDLRQKILDAYGRKLGSQRTVAALFGVSRAFLEQLLRRRRTTGEIAPRPHAGGRQPRCDPGGTLCPAPPPARVGPQCGHHVPCPPAPGAPTDKKALHATERDTPRVTQARAAYQQRTATRDLRRVKFMDEAGVNLAMTRLDGRAPRGERSVGTIPRNYGANSTLMGALGIDGLHALMTVEGAPDADVFRTYVKQVLGPTLAPGDMVALDHLSAHKAPGIQQALARRRVRRRYLPPYAPDLSPLALCLSQVKTALRAAKARTRMALEVTLQQVMKTVTAIDAQNWVRPCGYALQSCENCSRD